VNPFSSLSSNNYQFSVQQKDDGKKNNGPEIYSRNQDKLFPRQGALPPKKKRKSTAPKEQPLHEIIENVKRNEQPTEQTVHRWTQL